MVAKGREKGMMETFGVPCWSSVLTDWQIASFIFVGLLKRPTSWCKSLLC